MRSEPHRLEEQLRRSFEGEAWHGPSVIEALDGVDAGLAAEHPIDEAHSIWALVLHLAATYRLVLRRLAGDPRPLSAEEDFPAVPPPTDADWAASVEALRAVNLEFRRAVAGFRVDRLDDLLVPESPYPAYTQFIGITQHDLYHAGQIVLIKRAAQSARRHATVQELKGLTDDANPAEWQRAADSIRHAGGYRWVGLYEVTDSTVAAIAWTGDEPPAYLRFPREAGLTGVAVASRQPVIVQDVANDPRYLTAFATTGSEAIFPILGSTGEVIGTIDVESDKRHAFSDRDERFGRACASALQPLWLARNRAR